MLSRRSERIKTIAVKQKENAAKEKKRLQRLAKKSKSKKVYNLPSTK